MASFLLTFAFTLKFPASNVFSIFLACRVSLFRAWISVQFSEPVVARSGTINALLLLCRSEERIFTILVGSAVFDLFFEGEGRKFSYKRVLAVKAI